MRESSGSAVASGMSADRLATSAAGLREAPQAGGHNGIGGSLRYTWVQRAIRQRCSKFSGQRAHRNSVGLLGVAVHAARDVSAGGAGLGLALAGEPTLARRAVAGDRTLASRVGQLVAARAPCEPNEHDLATGRRGAVTSWPAASCAQAKMASRPRDCSSETAVLSARAPVDAAVRPARDLLGVAGRHERRCISSAAGRKVRAQCTHASSLSLGGCGVRLVRGSGASPLAAAPR